MSRRPASVALAERHPAMPRRVGPRKGALGLPEIEAIQVARGACLHQPVGLHKGNGRRKAMIVVAQESQYDASLVRLVDAKAGGRIVKALVKVHRVLLGQPFRRLERQRAAPFLEDGWHNNR